LWPEYPNWRACIARFLELSTDDDAAKWTAEFFSLFFLAIRPRSIRILCTFRCLSRNSNKTETAIRRQIFYSFAASVFRLQNNFGLLLLRSLYIPSIVNLEVDSDFTTIGPTMNAEEREREKKKREKRERE
jgi:hypothetical protein